MSEFRVFKCDVCGNVFQTGIRISGDKRQAIVGGRTRWAFRIDFCDDCFEKMMEFCKADAFADESLDGEGK